MSEQGSVASGLLDGIKKNAHLTVIMVICGILVVFSPLAAGASVMMFVGILLAIGGIVQCVLAFQAGAFSKGLLIFVAGALTAIVGFYLINKPLAGLAVIAFFLAVYFIVTGTVGP